MLRISGRDKRPSGFMALEMAALCALFLPVAILGVSLYGLSHDENLVQNIPESLMRETPGRIVTWRSDGALGSFELDQARARGLIQALAESALAELIQGTIKLNDISASACYWLYNVDEDSGSIDPEELVSECVALGPIASDLSLDTARINLLRTRGARPAFSAGEPSGFMSQLMLIGVAVGGRYTPLLEPSKREVLRHGAVWIPREDVKL